MVTMIKENESINKSEMVLFELISGVVFCGLVVQVAFFFFPIDVLYYSCGWWSGIVIACFMAFHMYRSLSSALDLEEGMAMSSVRKSSLIRYTTVLVVMVIVHYAKIGSVVAYIFGVLMLKTGAYFQPIVHKIFIKFLNTNQGDN